MKDITQEERKIYALFDNDTIRVYQAYNTEIAEEALRLGTFVEKYVNEWIVKITDITEEVKRIKQHIDKGTFTKDLLPKEQEYIVQ